MAGNECFGEQPGDYLVSERMLWRPERSWKGSGQLKIAALYQGRALLEVQGRELRLAPGMFHITKSGETYGIHQPAQRDYHILLVEFSDRTVAECSEAIGGYQPKEFTRHIYSEETEVSPLLGALWRATEGGADALHLEELSLKLCQAMLRMNRAAGPEISNVVRSSTREYLKSRCALVADYIVSNLSRELPLEELASVAHLSRSRFVEAFTQTMGMPPHRFLRAERLREARRLLNAHDLSVQEVALKVGFSSGASFSTTFRATFGQTPSEHRASLR
ncbi:MAG: helix-turn-helix transcriptional regulator [Armatimonadetes bacterium]|nr:helix-turn-helix transcriptional regulator [Armatimonadota bacterium]